MEMPQKLNIELSYEQRVTLLNVQPVEKPACQVYTSFLFTVVLCTIARNGSTLSVQLMNGYLKCSISAHTESCASTTKMQSCYVQSDTEDC